MYKYSFIIPVYNCEKKIKKCVQSIKDIKLKNYEIILVDDGSQDDSGRICDELQYECKRIRCIHQQNQGVSVARNQGLIAAMGDYICFFDADDSIEPGKLCKLLKRIEEEKTVIDIAVFGMGFDYYHKGRRYRTDEMHVPLQGIEESSTWSACLYELYQANSLNSICNKVFRRDLLMEYNLYLREDMFLYEDLEYTIRCMTVCNTILFEPDVFYHYRQREDEGNAGRRLARIDYISSLVSHIEKVLDKLVKKTGVAFETANHILLSLYLVLAREKIAVSSRKQIKQICNDFIEWYQRRKIKIPVDSQRDANLLLNRDVTRLLLRRKYTYIRHRIAVAVKNTIFYQKMKG